MLKLSLRSLAARKVRYLLASIAIILGVAFVTGALVLTDSLRKVFDDLSKQVVEDVAVQVRAEDPFGRRASIDDQLPPVPESLLPVVEGVDGVERASGDVEAFVYATTPDGELIETGGAPVFAFNWDGPERSVSAFELLDGAAPVGGDQTVVDQRTADRYDLAIGETVQIRSTGEPRDVEITGLIRLGENDSAGAVYFLFDTPTAQAIAGTPGEFASISAAATEGVSQEELAARVQAALPDGFEAVTGAQVGDEFSDSFSRFIDVFQWVLLIFGIVALIVSTFLISNTFSIVLGQRVRELGLLRAIGTRQGQIMRAVLGESLAVGLFGSVVGGLLGLGVAALLRAIIGAITGGSPPGGLVVKPTTWAVALVVGTLVTILSSLLPAWRAGRVSPVTAMREGASATSGRLLFVIRLVAGASFGALGVLMLGVGLFGDLDSTANELILTGVGAVLVFFGVALLSVVIARPVTLFLGLPPFALGVLLLGAVVALGGVGVVVAAVISGNAVAMVGGAVFAVVLGLVAKLLIDTGIGGLTVAGRLARENAARNPRRSTSTAAALMIGLALVAMASVVGQSLKATISEQVDSQLIGDFFFTDTAFGGITPTFGAEVADLPEVGEVAMVRQGEMRVAGETKQVSAIPAGTADAVLRLDFGAGGFEALEDRGLILHRDPARDLGLDVGSAITVEFVQTGPVELTVVGVYDEAIAGLGNWMISTSTFEANFAPGEQRDLFGAATLAGGVEEATAQRAIEAVAQRYPEVEVENRSEFRRTQQQQVDQPLATINVLLVFSLLNALFGIANTMALSVIERTRELGLLRAVGMSRGQVRRMVRWESIIVAGFGAALGVALGLLFGVALAQAMPDNVVGTVAVPFPVLTQIGVLAVVFGLMAAMLPARRAARMNVLEAIATE